MVHVFEEVLKFCFLLTGIDPKHQTGKWGEGSWSRPPFPFDSLRDKISLQIQVIFLGSSECIQLVWERSRVHSIFVFVCCGFFTVFDPTYRVRKLDFYSIIFVHRSFKDRIICIYLYKYLYFETPMFNSILFNLFRF